MKHLLSPPVPATPGNPICSEPRAGDLGSDGCAFPVAEREWGLSINWLSGLIPLLQTRRDDDRTKHKRWRKVGESEVSPGSNGWRGGEESQGWKLPARKETVPIVWCELGTHGYISTLPLMPFELVTPSFRIV